MNLERNSPAGQGGACGHFAGDHSEPLTPKAALAQGRARLARSVLARQHGNGYRVEVEPHPRVKKGEAGFNRRFSCLVQARDYARGLSDARGWPFVDECANAEPLILPQSALDHDHRVVGRWAREWWAEQFARDAFNDARRRRG